MSIRDVCAAVSERLSNIDETTLQNAESALTSWIALIDTIDRLPIENERIKKIVSDTTTELFKDINISLILSVSENNGAACVLARGCIEKCIYIIYFLDHPMTAFQWSTNGLDLSFSAIAEEMSIQNYFVVATGRDAKAEVDTAKLIGEIRKIYRQYSESVHGKYKFTETHKGKTVVSKEYYRSIKRAATVLQNITEARLIG